MTELRYALLNEKAEFGHSVIRMLARLNVKIHSCDQLSEFKKLTQEQAFDVFIRVTDHPEKEQAELKGLLADVSYLFTCLFSGEPVLQEDFDFTMAFSDFQTPEKLKRVLENLHHLALRLKTRQELSSLVLHDLRTPLQNLSGYVDMLLSGTFGELNAGQIKILQTVNAQVDIADELVQELSLLLRMRKSEFALEKQKTDLSRLIQETLRAVWVLADRKNIKLLPHVERDLPPLLVDPLAIRRVLFNLLLNALKFSPKNSTVRLMANLETSQTAPAKIHVRITDSGPGIPPQHFSTIFEPYFRLQTRGTGIKGHGLGLYIAKLFVEAHQGVIGVYNNREGGATFYFMLPVVSSRSPNKK